MLTNALSSTASPQTIDQIIDQNTQQNAQLTDAELLRYARQILLDGWDIDAQARLKTSHVIIVGMGGLGCPLAQTLVRAGVGRLTIFDGDTVDESNLQRQTLFLPEDVGKSKALTAKARLEAMNEFCPITAHACRLDESSDTGSEAKFMEAIASKSPSDATSAVLVCDCTDNFATRDRLNRLTVRERLPLLSASAIAQSGQLALFESYLATGCYHCLFHPANTTDERRCVDSGVLASTTQIMGNLQAQAALHFLGLGQNVLAQTLVLWQGTSFSLRKLRYQQDPACPVCATDTTLATG